MPNKLHMLEPVTIKRERDHQFKSRIPKKDLTKGQHDLCLHCMDGKHNPRNHHAFPESVNRRSNTSWASGNTTTHYWYDIFNDLLVKSDLPTGLARVYVEGIYTFGDKFGRRQKPDQENYRYPCSKALADTMVRGGWITDDSWSDEIGDFQFEFGGLQFEFIDGLYRMELRIFPTLALGEPDGVIIPDEVDGPRDVEPLGPVVYA
jgi:hypothetical protein